MPQILARTLSALRTCLSSAALHDLRCIMHYRHLAPHDHYAPVACEAWLPPMAQGTGLDATIQREPTLLSDVDSAAVVAYLRLFSKVQAS